IANLKAALARNEGEHEHRTNINLQGGDPFTEPKSRRKPAGDIGSNEASKKCRSRQKTQSIDLDELLGNSPPWPPVSSPGEMYADDDRDIGSSGDWVDKVMVNKLDGARGTTGSWEAENSRLFYLPEQSYNMFPGGNGFEIATTDDLDELDAATSDSSEPDLLWQYNHSKLPSFS
nr:kinesin-like protein KIN-14I isoform X1 [Tanacetum cinerariifolium]